MAAAAAEWTRNEGCRTKSKLSVECDSVLSSGNPETRTSKAGSVETLCC